MKNLLIVTEQEQIKKSLKAVLDDFSGNNNLGERFLFLSAATPEEALRTVGEKRIDIVIIDTPVKNLHVIQFLQSLRKKSPQTVPIVLLSTSEENIKEELLENKVYEWTVKPFKRKELVHLIWRAEERLQLMRRVKDLEDEKRAPNLAVREPVAEDKDLSVRGEELTQLFYYYQETFRKFSRILTNIFEPEKLFGLIVTTLEEVFEVGKLAILLRGRSGHYKIKSALRIKKEIVEEFNAVEGEGIAGWLSKNGQILIKQNKNIPLSIKEEMELLEAEVCIPLFSNGDLLGFLSLGKKITGGGFSPNELRFLYMMSGYTALAIQNSALYKEIIQHREHLSDIMRNISSGVLTIDNEGKIASINKSAQDILGVEGNIIGREIQKAGSIIADIMLKTLHEDRIYNRHEIMYPGKNISLGVSAVPLRDELNKIKGALMVFQNISEVKRIEEELNKTREEEFWKELTSRIAHGIRNPLVSISTFAQLLPEKKGEENFVKDYHETVLDSVSRLNHVVNRLEKLSDASHVTLSMQNINSVLEEVIKDFGGNFEKQKIQVNKNFESSVPESLVDVDRLKEVFANLIKNSLAAMGQGGKLDIETAYSSGNNELYIAIKDNGKGIELEDMSKVFSPFFTTENKELGLGLPIAKQVIEKHGGKTKLSSVPKKGTTFEMFLPVILKQDEAPKQSPAPVRPVVAQPAKKATPTPSLEGPVSLEEEVAKIERKLIVDALKKSEGIKVKAAKLLNISRRMLTYKIEKLDIK